MRAMMLLAVVGSGTLLACGGADPVESAEAAAEARGARAGAAARFDAHWMLQMIPHHASAVEMGLACGAAGVRPELLDFCAGVVEVQSAEIEQMRGWLRAWYGLDAAAVGGGMMGGGMMGGGMMGGGMGGAPDLSGLEGAAFERAFLDEMIPHHQMAVHMSAPCVARASHPELRALCRSIIASQSAEIVQMEAWRCEWFGACSTGGADGGHGGGPHHRPRR